MRKNPNATPFRQALACVLSVAIVFPGPLAAALTDIYNEPLAQPAASVKPNIMLILDDSGSMEQQYTPDYLGRRFGGSNRLCFDSGDDFDGAGIGTITGGLDNCEAADVPLMTPEINTQYYNPEIRYFPAVNFDGTSMPSMTATNTGNWTAVPTDGVSPAGVNSYRRDTYNMVENSSGTTVATVNLVTDYPDRLWCYSQSDTVGSVFTAADVAADPTRLTAADIGQPKCRTNSAYSYPDAKFSFGKTSGGAIKYVTGAPYYYRLAATEHCTDQTLSDCVASATPTATHPVPAPVRYCSDSTTNPTSPLPGLTSCQAKYRTGFFYPKFLGKVNPGTTGSPGQVSIANLSIATQNDSAAATITAIRVNGVNILAGNINLASGFTPTQAATAIRNAINANTGASNHHATCVDGTTQGRTNNCTGTTVTVRFGPAVTGSPAPAGSGSPSTATTGTVGAAPNGSSLTVEFNVTGTTAATSTATISGVGNGEAITAFSVSGTPLIPSSITCSSCGASATARNNYMASQLAAAINSLTGTHGFSAISSGNVVTITAPAAAGSSVNGVVPVHVAPGITISKTAFSGGVTAGDVDMTTTTTFGGGGDPTGASVASRTGVGSFSRVTITPAAAPFPKYPARTDCAGTACTYEEEMTNFANWYAYYRTRMAMAKSAIGRAFVGITDSFRVGFITINPSGDLTNRFRDVADFAAGAGGAKDLWYQWLYKQSSHGATPLREALARVGRYFAGVTSGINSGMPGSPIQLACQPNFAILTTDGYWNGNAGVKLDGSAIGNQDNVDAGYSKRSEARYDGGLAGSTDTLADVALYYYKTDLRTDLADQVPISTADPAPHQHLTLFTVGMGLAGQLTYDKNYPSGASADFERLKIPPASGGLDWPVPAANSETALDDLWHAAVNGRGTFFSAKDPAELADAIFETLSTLNARIGAGAAAATSNLQPVAGDNFAFTAQFETVSWIGDLKARTIDLSTGTVAFRELWAAAPLLDARGHTTRRIYTFDPADVAPGGDNLNKLRSFCWPGAIGNAAYPTCTDGAGLTAAEMDYFEPMITSAAPSNQPALVQAAAITANGAAAEATKERLLDFLRGDTSYEIGTGSTLTDLFRNRTSILGDIINAQPAYVKASPFSYNTGNFAGRDPFYQEFRSTTNGATGTRKGTVFAAANDGFLHAFETDPDNNPYFQTAGIGTTITTDDTFTGTLDTSPTAGEGAERWAYVPSFVMKDMKRLADSPYVHRFYTDGSPVVGDVCFGHSDATPCASQANWRTILVAGVNAGGRGYYALDVTDPDNPKGLWEVKGGTGTACLTAAQADSGTYSEDCNIGFTFGNPLIVKLPATLNAAAPKGKWVVIFTSGLNNVSPGDGVGYLYIVDAQTGKILKRYSTGTGSSTTPSGLNKINAWADNAAFDNTARTVYAGDVLGNLWRIQLDDSVAAVPQHSVTRLATLVDPSSVAQPITTKPELGEVSGKRVVLVGTGKFLGLSDKADTQRQTIYAIKDEMNSIGSPVVPIVRSGAFPTSSITGFVRQDLTASPTNPATERVTTTNTVDFANPTVLGWFIDLPDGGTGGNGTERVNVDPILQLGTLVVASNVPSTDTCTAGGFGWVNFLDYKTGAYIPGATANMASTKISASLVVGINVIQLPGGTVKTIVTTADNQQLTRDTPVAPTSFAGRRVSWREIFFER
ncbi:MAG: PilC/PilY family type IV pilus protein [Pseudomonadota bacterium]